MCSVRPPLERALLAPPSAQLRTAQAPAGHGGLAPAAHYLVEHAELAPSARLRNAMQPTLRLVASSQLPTGYL